MDEVCDVSRNLMRLLNWGFNPADSQTFGIELDLLDLLGEISANGMVALRRLLWLRARITAEYLEDSND